MRFAVAVLLEYVLSGQPEITRVAPERKINMNQKSIITLAVVAAVAIGGWYVYQESQKSDLEKAAEDISDTMEDIADDLKN